MKLYYRKSEERLTNLSVKTVSSLAEDVEEGGVGDADQLRKAAPHVPLAAVQEHLVTPAPGRKGGAGAVVGARSQE